MHHHTRVGPRAYATVASRLASAKSPSSSLGRGPPSRPRATQGMDSPTWASKHTVARRRASPGSGFHGRLSTTSDGPCVGRSIHTLACRLPRRSHRADSPSAPDRMGVRRTAHGKSGIHPARHPHEGEGGVVNTRRHTAPTAPVSLVESARR
jgi:hypothetical protein